MMMTMPILDRVHHGSPRLDVMTGQIGFALIEMIVALSILAAVVLGSALLINQSADDTRSTAAAQHLKTFGDAANLAIRDSTAAILALPVGTAPTATVPAVFDVAWINAQPAISGGRLPAGFSPRNVFNQTICVLVLQPTPGNLTSLVVTEEGDVMPDGALASAIGHAGAAAGGIYTDPSFAPATTVMGARNGWSIPIGNFANSTRHCNGAAGATAITAGHLAMALWFLNGETSTGFLYRNAVPNRPDLNAMNTPLIMGSVQVVGAGCVAGAIARDNAGGLLSCDVATLLWKAAGGSQFWQDPVATLANLPACNLAAKGQTRVVETPATGTGPRAYTCDGVSAWKALALDNGGNITIPGTATIAALNGNLQITATVSAGAACTGEGRIASSNNTNAPSGLLLSCQNGFWKTAQGTSGLVGGWVFKISGVALNGSYSTWFLGYGAYDSSTGNFSGQLTCDPVTNLPASLNCKAYYFTAEHWSTTAADAYNWAGNPFLLYLVGVQNLPVNSVTRRW
jgi:prepilin-type N-terminal cleavage/methylation domain-containing protein